MSLKSIIHEWSGVVGTVLLLGTCAYGGHHANTKHGREAGMSAWDFGPTAIYYAGESFLADHGPVPRDGMIGLSEKEVLARWGAPDYTEPNTTDGRGLFWIVHRDDEVAYCLLQNGSVVAVGWCYRPKGK